jgi:hypothetical protein
MKTIIYVVLIVVMPVLTYGQIFEEPVVDTAEFGRVKVDVGGDFALQFQGLEHNSPTTELYELVPNFNLPTANLNLDVTLADGISMYLRTYLSSRHHPESWVKGGHINIQSLNFIREGFLDGVMDRVSIRTGLDEINYGDAHFRRTDNADAIDNPFVGNYVMDAYSTEVFGELMFYSNGVLVVLGLSNGKLNQNVTVTTRTNSDNQPSFYGKVGYDNQFGNNFRARLTGSWYINQGTTTGLNLYGGDRAGARYYSVLVPEGEEDVFTSGRFNPGFVQLTAFQVNPFLKIGGLEFFGVYEYAGGGEADGEGFYHQLAGELIYRLGGKEQFYGGARYNQVTGQQTEDAATSNIRRLNVGGGWFVTPNILAKLEYVRQDYSGDGWQGQRFEEAWFRGIMIEGVITF